MTSCMSTPFLTTSLRQAFANLDGSPVDLVWPLFALYFSRPSYIMSAPLLLTHAPSKDCPAWIEGPLAIEIMMRVASVPTTRVSLAYTLPSTSYACPVHGLAYRLLSVHLSRPRPRCSYRPGSTPYACSVHGQAPRFAFLTTHRGRFLTAEPSHPSTPYPSSRLGHDKIMDLD